ncbi:amino acid adenylation domain-containing protein [Vibrio sp. TRT 17S01]|uniref:amino acid adenylation domain-containing protein n=1 Tax=Vibrio sp. TRT 17S01 TaxID=3418505 RepID=UPI003CE7A847
MELEYAHTLPLPDSREAHQAEAPNTSLLTLLERQVALQAHHIAVEDQHVSLSYLAFYQQIQAIAFYLADKNVQADSCIGLFTEASTQMLTGAWGILASGNAYLPLSPEYPEERIKYMVKDSGIRVIYTQEALKAQLQRYAPDGVVIFTDADVKAHAEQAGAVPDMPSTQRPTSSNLAYIIYTSGSTGNPKGVMIEHASIVNQMLYLQDRFGFNEQTVILQKTPMSFDAAQWEILAPVFGGKVVVGAPGIYRDTEALIGTIIQRKVTTLQCVPTLLQALVDDPGFYDCSSLTQVFSGGEALTAQLSRQFFAVHTQCELINLYGPTECTINASTLIVNEQDVRNAQGAIAIGYPVSDTAYYILDEHGAEVGTGTIGELYIGGVQLARGYLGQPELTQQKFIANPLSSAEQYPRLYRTGDLAYFDEKGAVHFAGRCDNQVKLRGFRIELDEIRHAVEAHSWVKNAAMLIKDDARTGFQNLVCCLELDAKEAALMDQGNHGNHHQSKANKLQVKAQLSGGGRRDDWRNELACSLPGKNGQGQREKAFARKTYRFYDGGPVTQADLLALLAAKPAAPCSTPLRDLSWETFGELMAYFSEFISEERLLAKYAYASPGALYATQMYLEIHHLFGLESGIYYYHPGDHALSLIAPLSRANESQLTIHFSGKNSAIEPVYKNNILEVLEMEVGHMLGLFDDVLPAYGLAVVNSVFMPEVKARLNVDLQDHYLGSFGLGSANDASELNDVELLVQCHNGAIDGLADGQYSVEQHTFTQISDALIEKKHVIAINQEVYQRSSFGIAMLYRGQDEWMQFIQLGRKLQQLQSNDINIGLMSSGYSSKSGNDLPSAKTMSGILHQAGKTMAPFYFCIGGRISDEQKVHEGMKEDTVHMRGPTEMLKDDLALQLPSYMIPNQVIIVDKLPLTVNGKVDYKALESCDAVVNATTHKPFVAPEGETETQIAELWKGVMKWESVSATDDFFECGGNSLTAVSLVKQLNRTFDLNLPLQLLFEKPTVQKLAQFIDSESAASFSRLIRLHTGEQDNVFCWPGLGGYPMNLRLLASQASAGRSFYGIQAYGINDGEVPYATIAEMARHDIEEIRRHQPQGPYTLWGYSFGARVAFEVAYQLEQAGETVQDLHLIAPGSPIVQGLKEQRSDKSPTFDNPAFVSILFSVFAHKIDGPVLERCLNEVTTESEFVTFIHVRYPNLDLELIQRIIAIVKQTYEFEYTFRELQERVIQAPVSVYRAQGDDYSFLEQNRDFSVIPLRLVDLDSDHYQLLKATGVGELTQRLYTDEN